MIRELKGLIADYHADYGLVVSWGGFTDPALKEAKEDYFKVRLWDSENLIDSIKENYQNLPENIRTELTLKTIWIPVSEDSEF